MLHFEASRISVSGRTSDIKPPADPIGVYESQQMVMQCNPVATEADVVTDTHPLEMWGRFILIFTIDYNTHTWLKFYSKIYQWSTDLPCIFFHSLQSLKEWRSPDISIGPLLLTTLFKIKHTNKTTPFLQLIRWLSGLQLGGNKSHVHYKGSNGIRIYPNYKCRMDPLAKTFEPKIRPTNRRGHHAIGTSALCSWETLLCEQPQARNKRRQTKLTLL